MDQEVVLDLREVVLDLREIVLDPRDRTRSPIIVRRCIGCKYRSVRSRRAFGGIDTLPQVQNMLRTLLRPPKFTLFQRRADGYRRALFNGGEYSSCGRVRPEVGMDPGSTGRCQIPRGMVYCTCTGRCEIRKGVTHGVPSPGQDKSTGLRPRCRRRVSDAPGARVGHAALPTRL